jgi:hypothetical protein
VPIDFGSVWTNDECCGRYLDAIFFVYFFALRIGIVRPEKDEIAIEKILEFFVFVKLLIQQCAGPSTIREKIDQDQLILGFCLEQGIIDRALEPVLCPYTRHEK